ncbi:MAG TPA: MGMT family protein [Chloroflexota bacterium]|nr:MGMT family protein [Chloroflexota bacterium]
MPYIRGVDADSRSSPRTPDFCRGVYKLVAQVPAGRVTTYGDIALALGWPRHARLVGHAMSVCPDRIPAHRVVNHRGEPSRAWNGGHPEQQRALLLAEGITFRPDGSVDLKKHIHVLCIPGHDRLN